MDKITIRIFILGFIWVVAGIVTMAMQKNENDGLLFFAIGLVIESVALMRFFWMKMKKGN
jgi:hypothetical protein